MYWRPGVHDSSADSQAHSHHVMLLVFLRERNTCTASGPSIISSLRSSFQALGSAFSGAPGQISTLAFTSRPGNEPELRPPLAISRLSCSVSCGIRFSLQV